MKKICSCITIIFLGVILLTGCAAKNLDPIDTTVVDNTFKDSIVMTVDKQYNAESVVLTIDKLELMKNDTDKKYNVIKITGKYTVLRDSLYWSLENSEITVNSKEVTVPMLLTTRTNPLNKVTAQPFELVAYVTVIKIDDVKNLVWVIQKPAIKNGEDFYDAGSVLNIPLTIIK